MAKLTPAPHSGTIFAIKTPVKILATYHPAALLRNPNWKKDAWADLQMVMAEMGLKRPKA